MTNIVGIYMIRNKVNGKMYIGQSMDVGRRNKTELMQLRKGWFHTKRSAKPHPIVISFQKHGEENFEFMTILELTGEDATKDNLNHFEALLITKHKTLISENGYNILACGVGNGMLGYKFSNESKMKMSQSHKGYTWGDVQREERSKSMLAFYSDPELGQKRREEVSERSKKQVCSAETRLKISKSNKGMKRTPEQCKALGDRVRKHFQEHPEVKERIAAAHRGRKMSEEQRRKMSEERKGIPLSMEHREAIIASKATPEYRSYMSSLTKGDKNPMYGSHRVNDENPNAKLNWEKVDEIRELLKTHLVSEVAKMYGVNWGTIDKIKKNKRWVRNED